MATPATYQFAGFWKRFLAIFIDGILFWFAGILLALIVSLAVRDSSVKGGIMYVLETVGGWLYFALMESSSKQATLGKMAVGIQVTDTKGKRISFGRATGRYFAKAIAVIAGIFTLGIGAIIWYGMAGWTKKKQAVHDMIAGTYVIKK